MNNRILYSMFYDMLEQTHYAYKSKNGVAIVCPNTPVWLKLAQGTSAHARLFFRDFLDGYVNREQLVGIVAEKNVATACAKVYAQENSITFAQKELIAYFLPQGVEMGLNDSGLNALGKGELRPATASEMPLVSEWISAFYSETLAAAQPLFENGTAAFHQLHESIPQSQVPPKQQETHSNPLARLFIWWDSLPVAMGMLTGAGKTCRINLVYVPPNLRGRCYGKALVSSLAGKAREAAQIPVLYTNGDNITAIQLYTSLNFCEAGRLAEFRFLGTV